MTISGRHRGGAILGAVVLAAVALPARGQESPYLYGIHDAEPMPSEFLNRLNAGGVTGWVTATVAIGANPGDMSGADFRAISNQGHTVICRLNNAYCNAGTIPPSSQYAAFAQRCANFVANSQGCSIWVIGNETNLAAEWPPVNGRKVYVSPQSYASCFRLCYDAIKAVAPTHKVLTQALAPWAGPYGTGTVCGFPHDAMPLNWVTYLNQMLTAIAGSAPGPYGTGPDGIALHINSRGYRYSDIHSTQKVSAGGQMLYFSFYVYKDWVNLGIPQSLWHLPLYATECNGNYYWKGGHPEAPAEHYEPGWVQEIYAEVNRWNVQAASTGKPLYRCVNLYRWCAYCDPWNIDGADNPYKGQILSDLDAAVQQRYQWQQAPTAAFTASPLSGPAPLTVSFTDTSTGWITGWNWSFGDGYGSTQRHPARTYLNPGAYTVTLQVTGPAGSDDEVRAGYIQVLEPPGCLACSVAHFEDLAVGTEAVFQKPRYSPTTRGHLATTPDEAAVTDEVPAFEGTKCSKVRWAWLDAAPGRWLRLTTANTTRLPNPAVDLRRPLRLRLRLDSGALRVCAGIRETGIDVPVGVDGGITGTIEWVGAESVVSGAPQGVLITAQPGVWQTVVLPLNRGVMPFTGDGVLSAANHKGVLEHLALAPAGGAGPFTLYVDAISQPCPPRGDFDRDDDVDLRDFGHLQACLTGMGIPQQDPACLEARLDGDLDVDQSDVGLFLECLGGPGQPVAPSCRPE